MNGLQFVGGVLALLDLSHQGIEAFVLAISLEDIVDMVGIFGWHSVGESVLRHLIIILSVMLDRLAWKLLV